MTAFSTGGGGEFIWPVMVGGIVGPILSGLSEMRDTFSAVGWAIPFRAPESMNVDAFVYVTGATVWASRKIGLYDFDPTGLNLGAEVVAVTGLSPAASSEIITTFTPVALIKDAVYWIAAGGGTGTTKAIRDSQATDTTDDAAPTGVGLINTVGAITLDLQASSVDNVGLEHSLEVSANTPAASGTLIAAGTVEGACVPLCALRKSS